MPSLTKLKLAQVSTYLRCSLTNCCENNFLKEKVRKMLAVNGSNFETLPNSACKVTILAPQREVQQSMSYQCLKLRCFGRNFLRVFAVL